MSRPATNTQRSEVAGGEQHARLPGAHTIHTAQSSPRSQRRARSTEAPFRTQIGPVPSTTRRAFKRRDTLEETLVQLWQKIVGVEPIGVHDDFFELGGDSLSAAQLFAELPELVSVTLHLGELISAPTVDRLADRVRLLEGRPSSELLVPLNPTGRDAAPRDRPRSLRKCALLPTSRTCSDLISPCTRCRPSGSPAKSLPSNAWRTSHRATSARCTAASRAEKVLLAGYSFGGMVAWEMADQLLDAGREVAFVGLIDASPPQLHNLVTPFLYSVPVRIEGRESRRLALDYFASGQRPTLGEEMWMLRAVSPDRRFAAVAAAALRPTRSYVPRRSRCPVTLFRSSHGGSRLSYEPKHGWGPLAGDRFTIRDVSGDHVSILSRPFVTILAGELRAQIQESVNGSQDQSRTRAPRATRPRARRRALRAVPLTTSRTARRADAAERTRRRATH